jgi:hypothetical protein
VLSGDEKSQMQVLDFERGVFRSVDELVQAVTDYVAGHNDHPKPFIWAATPFDILEKVTRARKKLDKVAVFVTSTTSRRREC